MRKKKLPSFFLPVLLMILLLFSGCSGGSSNRQTGAVEKEQTPEQAGAAQDQDGQDAEAAVDAPRDGLLRIAIPDPVATMDIHRTTSDYLLPLNIYEKLFSIRRSEDGGTELVMELAREYSVSDDGLTYSITLRDDAFFADGTPVKASDVAFTFTRMLSLEGSVQTDFADSILGADAVMEHTADVLEGIEVLDDTHLRITLSDPFTGYIYQLATPSCSILSEKCVTEAGEAFGTDPEKTFGSGPYRVTEFGKNRILLELNPYYKKEVPSVKEVEILVLDPALMNLRFQNGGLDLLDTYHTGPEILETYYSSEKWKDRIISLDCTEIRYLMMNVKSAPLQDLQVRKAVQMAVDRQAILDTLFAGRGSLVDGIYPRGLPGFSEENQGWLQYDPEAARTLLQEAGPGKNDRIELAVNSTSSTQDLAVLEMIRRDLQAVGLEVCIVSYDAESFLALRRRGKLTAYASKWTADYNDPDNFIYTFFGNRKNTRQRSGNYEDEAVMQRIWDARRIPDEDTRLAEYASLEKLLIREEALWVPLFSTEHPYVLGERIESFTPHWAAWRDFAFSGIVFR